MADPADFGWEEWPTGLRALAPSGESVRVGSLLGAGNEGAVFAAEGCKAASVLKVLRRNDGTRRTRLEALVQLKLGERHRGFAAPAMRLEVGKRLAHLSAFAPGFDVDCLGDDPTLLNPRQRLMAVLRLGALLTRLHGLGLAFGDLNKGAVRVKAASATDVEVRLVDFDSCVMPGMPLPQTLGTPDTAAPELLRGEAPKTVEGWQQADWVSFGHVALELLLARTAACGIEDPEQQVAAYMGIPPILRPSADRSSALFEVGLPPVTLSPSVRRQFVRLFDPDPSLRNGVAFLRALTDEVVNNHQVACARCGAHFLLHESVAGCFTCGLAVPRVLRAVLPNGQIKSVETDLPLTATMLNLGGRASACLARLFRLGGQSFVAVLDATPAYLLRAGEPMGRLPQGIHVPLLAKDRLRFRDAATGPEVFMGMA